METGCFGFRTDLNYAIIIVMNIPNNRRLLASKVRQTRVSSVGLQSDRGGAVNSNDRYTEELSMSKAKIIAAGTAGAVALTASVVDLKLAEYIGGIKRQTPDEAYEWQKEHYDVSFFDDLKKDDYIVASYDNYELHTVCCYAGNPTDKYVIISHGYTDNRYGDMKYMPVYLSLGYNCIIYDLRGHGVNKKTFCTYSLREAKDLNCLIEDTFERYGEDIYLGLHGESLGAATSVAVLKYSPEVKFVVADCGFSEIESVIKGQMTKMHLPQFLFGPVAAAYRLRYGYSLKQMRPVDSLDENSVPICFIHGARDSFILPEHSQKMYSRTQGYKELHIIPDAEHASSVLTAPEEYAKTVKDFLSRI
ncbi:MAG: alpha/beta hydrolase [Candidatus Weimeria sp.]